MAGKHMLKSDAAAFPSGIYFIRLKTRDVSRSIKTMLLK
jgi:hypothetical protein